MHINLYLFIMTKKARSDPLIFILHTFKRWKHLSAKFRESKIVPECKFLQTKDSSLEIRAESPEQHIDEGLLCNFPLGWSNKIEHTLQHDLLAVLEIRSKFKDDHQFIEKFRLSKLTELRALSEQIPRENHDVSNPIAGKFHWGLLRVLAKRCGFEDSDFVDRLKFGVKMTGVVEDGVGIFPKNEDFKTPEPQRLFCDYDVQCLNKHLKFDQVVWAETIKETSDPWPCLLGPVDINHLKNKYGENMKISGRFGLIKDNSVRLIDNLKSIPMHVTRVRLPAGATSLCWL
jgi:hypothetical protein